MSSKLPFPGPDCISRVRFSPVVGDAQLLASSWDSNLRLYDAISGQLNTLKKQELPLLDCTFMQDTTKCVSAGLARKVVLTDFVSQKEQCLGEHAEAVKCLEFHSKTQQVLTASWDRTLCAWDARRRAAPAATIHLGTKAFCMDVAEEKVVVGCADRTVQIFDVRKLGELLEKRESSLKNQIRAIKVNRDQTAFVTSSVEGRVAVEYFDQEENRQRYAFKCHRAREGSDEKTFAVNALEFHPGHGTFATGGSDGGVCVWDGQSKKRLWKLNPFHTSVSSLSFSADGTRLAIAVSYTFDEGERMPPPVPELVVRKITDCEVMPKTSQDS